MRSVRLREPTAVLLGAYDGGDPDLLDRYVELYREASSAGTLRREAIYALGNIPSPQATALLRNIASDTSRYQRIAVVRALAMQGTPYAIAMLDEIAGRAEQPRPRVFSVLLCIHTR